MNTRFDNKLGNKTILDLREFLWRLLEQWKLVLAVALCFTVVFLGYMHMHNEKEAKLATQTQKANQELTRESILDSLSQGDRAVVKNAELLFQKQQQLMNYTETAPIMKIATDKAKRLRTRWSIEADSEIISALAQGYVLALQKEENTSALLESSGVDANLAQFNELIGFGQSTNENTATINMDILLTEEMNTDAMKSEIEKMVNSIHDDLSKELTDHKIRNFKHDINAVSSQDISNKQIAALNNLTNINNQLSACVAAFTPGQQAAYDKLLLIDNSTAETAAEIKPEATITLNNIIAGLVLGGFLYIVFYFIYLLLSKKVMSAKILKGSQAHLIGEWYSQKAKERQPSIIRSLPVWKRHHKHYIDEESARQKCAESISNICRLKGLTNIALYMTTALNESQSVFIKELREELKADQMDLQLYECSRGNSIVLVGQMMLEAEGFLLAVIESKTKLKSIEDVLESCNEYDKPVLGSIYLG